MTTISIVSENVGTEKVVYRAVAGARQSQGSSVGEAIDALNSQLSDEEAGTLVIVQNLRPDLFFSAVQQQRLVLLMEQWRNARDHNLDFSAGLQAELEALVEVELKAAARRAEAIRHELS